MDALDQSAALIRRGAELRDRSMRVRAAAMETVESCRRLMEAAAAAQEAVIRAHGGEGPGARRKPYRVLATARWHGGPVGRRVRSVAW